MRIGITHLNLTGPGAEARIVFSLAKALIQLGHEVTIYAGEFDPSCYPNLHKGLDIRVARMNIPLVSVIGAVGFWERIWERVSKNILHRNVVHRIAHALDPNLDLLICHNDYSYQLAPHYKRDNPEVKIIWTMNNPPFQHISRNIKGFNLINRINTTWEGVRMKWYLPDVDAIVVLDPQREAIARRKKIEASILPVPVDFKKFYVPVKASQRRKRITLLGGGNLLPTRGFENIILAAAELREMSYPAEVELICRDTWKNLAYRNFLETVARHSGMERFTTFHFDGVSESDLKNILKAGDVFVLMNQVRLWSMIAFEAMAAGLPLILSRRTSMAQVLQDGENVLLVDPDRPDQIAEQARTLLSRPDFYEKIARNGQKFVKENLNWQDYAADLVRIGLSSPSQRLYVSKLFGGSA